jgi:hypothetical protein
VYADQERTNARSPQLGVAGGASAAAAGLVPDGRALVPLALQNAAAAAAGGVLVPDGRAPESPTLQHAAAATSPPRERPSAPAIDLDDLTDKVQRRLLRHITQERTRRGYHR